MTSQDITVLEFYTGHRIDQISAMSGYEVILRDIENQFLDKNIEKIKIKILDLLNHGSEFY